jgi:hypothetical protein
VSRFRKLRRDAVRAIDVRVETESQASPQAVFRVLRDGATWPRWSLFDAFDLERHGRDDPLGVGAIRVFSTRMSQASEEVIEMLPDRRLAYILLSRLSFQDYRAEVNLLPGPMRGSSACREGDFLLDGHEARTVPAERT